jgi:putative tryptophan/tyrosine transport system substrate-binding protein
MRRREFITLLGGTLAAWPLLARAQQKSTPVIGYLGVGLPQLQHPFVVAFREGLKENGFVDGENLAIEYRWAEEHYDRLPALAADLVRRKVDVIVATGEPSLRAAASATSTIPIVFVTGNDPVQSGLVAGLARPGGNMTGFTAIATELLSKRFELVSELLPGARLIALLVNSNALNVSEVTIRLAQQAASAKGLQLLVVKAGDEADVETAFASIAHQHADALVVSADAFFFARRDRIVALAAQYAVPAIYELQEFVSTGGLISYGPNVASLRRQVGIYAGKIIKGAKPADLPIQQPTKFDLMINLKAAKVLGLTVPPTLLAQADAVIE